MKDEDFQSEQLNQKTLAGEHNGCSIVHVKSKINLKTRKNGHLSVICLCTAYKETE